MLSITGELGRFEEFFSEAVYPIWPLWAAAVIGALAAALYVAGRRGWHRVALGHPVTTAAAAAVILALAVPAGYYLVSPLFERSLACEASPLEGAGAGSEKCEDAVVTRTDGSPTPAASPSAAPATPAPGESSPSLAPTPAASEPSPTVAPTPVPFEAGVAYQGEFHGADDFHFGRGKALLIETAPAQYVLRFEEFSVRNGPDLYVYLSPDASGYGDGSLELGTLKATDGAFNYDVPPGADVSQFKSAIVWCKQFSVLFAVAPLVAA
jgi:hypothetical protein